LARIQIIGIQALLEHTGQDFVPSGKHASHSRQTTVRFSGRLEDVGSLITLTYLGKSLAAQSRQTVWEVFHLYF